MRIHTLETMIEGQIEDTKYVHKEEFSEEVFPGVNGRSSVQGSREFF